MTIAAPLQIQLPTSRNPTAGLTSCMPINILNVMNMRGSLIYNWNIVSDDTMFPHLHLPLTLKGSGNKQTCTVKIPTVSPGKTTQITLTITDPYTGQVATSNICTVQWSFRRLRDPPVYPSFPSRWHNMYVQQRILRCSHHRRHHRHQKKGSDRQLYGAEDY